MDIKILGAGCTRCHQLASTTREVVKELGIDASVEYIQDINKIIEYSILTTPGLVINEKLVSSGRIPSQSQIVEWMEEILASN